jgi:hypothetical protein
MFSDVGIPGLVLLIMILAIPTTIIILIANRNSRLKRIEDKLDKSLSDKNK